MLSLVGICGRVYIALASVYERARFIQNRIKNKSAISYFMTDVLLDYIIHSSLVSWLCYCVTASNLVHE